MTCAPDLCLPAWCSYVRIWGGSGTAASNTGFLTVWLSSGANYTATGTMCASNVAVLAGFNAIVTCPAVSGTQYVTLVRYDPLDTGNLVVAELQIFRSSECCAELA